MSRLHFLIKQSNMPGYNEDQLRKTDPPLPVEESTPQPRVRPTTNGEQGGDSYLKDPSFKKGLENSISLMTDLRDNYPNEFDPKTQRMFTRQIKKMEDMKAKQDQDLFTRSEPAKKPSKSIGYEGKVKKTKVPNSVEQPNYMKNLQQ